MMNLSNYGIVTGRLVKDPAVYTNADGSRKTKITITTQNNYRNSQTGEKEAQFLPLEYFTPADRDDLQVFNYMYKGDKVTIQYTLKNVQYTDTENRKVYSLVLQIENIRLDETKSSTHANTAANTGGKKQTRQRSNSRSK